MEPLNCTIRRNADGCEVWTGTQFQTVDQQRVAAIFGLKPEQVAIHTTFLGGGFGRRANIASDFVVEAVHVAKAVEQPVKIVWTREDDIRGGYYRPHGHPPRSKVGSTTTARPWPGAIASFGQSIVAGTPFAGMIKNGDRCHGGRGRLRFALRRRPSPTIASSSTPRIRASRCSGGARWATSHTAFAMER